MTAESPYEFSGLKVTPELNRTVKGGAGGRLGVYLVVYGQKGRPATLTIEFLQDGEVVARSEPPVPDAAEDGRIAVLAQVPIHTLKPGRTKSSHGCRRRGAVLMSGCSSKFNRR